MPLTAQDIARCCKVRLAAVEANWPRILTALDACGLRSDLVEIAAASTITVETARTFMPIKEMMANPDHQPDLARRQAQYAPYTGRGFVQTTWLPNYQKLEPFIPGVVKNPDLLLQPENAALALAFFFGNEPTREHNVATAANAKRWDLVRQRVNGGMGAWPEFKACVDGLVACV